MLVVPMFDVESGELVSLQFIDPDGQKRFLRDGRTVDVYFPLAGDEAAAEGVKVAIAEGFATAASINESCHIATAVAFSDRNLIGVARALKRTYRKAKLIICADNDRETEGNPGITHGTAAALATKAALAIPRFPVGIEGSDFNDLAVAVGPDAVKEQIEKARPKITCHSSYEAAEAYAAEGAPLHFWRGSFYRYSNNAHHLISDEEIDAEVGNFLQSRIEMLRFTVKRELKPFEVNAKEKRDGMANLRSCVHLPELFEAPRFINQKNPLSDRQHLIAVKNGLLALDTLELFPPTSDYFNLHALDVDYVPGAQAPHWYEFLAQLWPHDSETVDCLQDVFGYLLEPVNDLQKILFLKGPPRSGKGTIAQVLSAMLGHHSIAKPTLKNFSEQYGLQNIMGKSLAIISDARIGKNSDTASAVELMLSISGGDNPELGRKFKSAVPVGNVRFLLLANELPPFADISSALPNRFVILPIFESFLGREDPDLFEKRLKPELPGILNFAIEGWRRLRYHDDNKPPHFVLPERSQAILDAFIELSNPLAEVIEALFVLDAEAVRDKEPIYLAYINT